MEESGHDREDLYWPIDQTVQRGQEDLDSETESRVKRLYSELLRKVGVALKLPNDAVILAQSCL